MHFHEKPTTYVSEVTLKVANLQEAIQFYQAIFLFRILRESEKQVDLTADGKTCLISLEEIEKPSEVKRTTGLFHLAILLPTRSHLVDFVKHLSNMQIPIGAGDHLVSEAIYFNDLDGNGIEVYADRDYRTWTWQKDMVDMDTKAVDFHDLLKEASLEGWQTLPLNTVIGHIHLQTTRLKEMEHFYVQGLGFQLVSQLADQALFVADNGYHHHIAFNTWGGPFLPDGDETTVGLQSFTIYYPRQEKRQAAIDRLEKQGNQVKINHDCAVIDPNGTTIYLKIAK